MKAIILIGAMSLFSVGAYAQSATETKAQRDCQRDLRLAAMRGKPINFSCNAQGYTARPISRRRAPRPTSIPVQPPTTRYVPSLNKHCTFYHNGAPPFCF